MLTWAGIKFFETTHLYFIYLFIYKIPVIPSGGDIQWVSWDLRKIKSACALLDGG
jgi:hypothetical protein